jgi:hypothetical protein
MRHSRSPTTTTNIAFGTFNQREGNPRLTERHLRLTERNLRLAEEELDDNTLGLEELQIVEERQTLRWLWEKIREEQTAGWARNQDDQEPAVAGL